MTAAIANVVGFIAPVITVKAFLAVAIFPGIPAIPLISFPPINNIGPMAAAIPANLTIASLVGPSNSLNFLANPATN